MNQDSFYSIDDSDQARRDTRLFANELYFEELGHFVEKWRCIKLNVSVSNCDTYGDAGARFSDAALINSPELVNDIEVYDEAIAKLSKNDMTYSSHLTMKSGEKVYYETAPSEAAIQAALNKKGWTLRYRLRGQIGWELNNESALAGGNSAVGIGSNIVLEFRYTPARRVKNGWSSYYNTPCPNGNCNIDVGKARLR